MKLLCECGRLSDVQQQLCAALSAISACDFPAKWPSLLPELISQFESNDLQTVTGMLLTTDSILERFRDVEKSDALYAELKYVLDYVCVPLTTLFRRLGAMLSSASSRDNRDATLVALRLVCRIFYSLNWQDLPEFFEDNMNQWMPEFEKYLALDGDPAGDSDEEGPLERLQAAIVENVLLYASKYEEEFAPYLPRFASAIWTRLMKSSSSAKHDQLTVTSIKFLASVVGNAVHATNFGDENTLRQITSAIVVPNLRLREVDLELFEDNPVEYISREFEAADSETRRRSARDLVQAMCKHHDALTTKLCIEHASTLLAEYAASPAKNWLAKDAALHLVVAVAVRAESRVRGVTMLSPNVNVLEVFAAHVEPELSPNQQQQHPIILADCIQFTATFRYQLEAKAVAQLVPLLAHHAKSRVRVVHTYAAACLDRLLATNKMPKEQLASHLTALFEALFSILEPNNATGTPTQSMAGSSHGTNGSRTDASSSSLPEWENEYAMKAVMRLLMLAEDSITPAAQIVTDKLTAALGRVCANPRNPNFNHYLFEALAVLVRAVCSKRRENADKFEVLLFPPFQSVLQMDVVEFAPYVFQILALLLTFRGSLSPAYVSLLPPLSNVQLWERRGNVPALAQLLEAYLSVGASTVVDQNQLEPILGVFQKLLASKQFEAYAFKLLSAIVSTVEPQRYVDKYLGTIMQLLLTRLQQQRDRVSYVHHVIAFFGLLAGQQSPALLIAKLDETQPGMLTQLVVHVIAPVMLASPHFNSPAEAKSSVVGLTRLLCEHPDSLHDPNASSSSWVALLAALLAVVASATNALPSTTQSKVLDDDLQLDDTHLGYDAAFSQLHFGTNDAPKDYFPNVPDMSAYLRNTVNQLCLNRPQPFQQLAQAAQTYQLSHQSTPHS